MKKKALNAQKLSLKKSSITPLNADALPQIKGGATITKTGCVQPTTTVQHTYAICNTAFSLRCTE